MAEEHSTTLAVPPIAAELVRHACEVVACGPLPGDVSFRDRPFSAVPPADPGSAKAAAPGAASGADESKDAGTIKAYTQRLAVGPGDKNNAAAARAGACLASDSLVNAIALCLVHPTIQSSLLRADDSDLSWRAEVCVAPVIASVGRLAVQRDAILPSTLGSLKLPWFATDAVKTGATASDKEFLVSQDTVSRATEVDADIVVVQLVANDACGNETGRFTLVANDGMAHTAPAAGWKSDAMALLQWLPGGMAAHYRLVPGREVASIASTPAAIHTMRLHRDAAFDAWMVAGAKLPAVRRSECTPEETHTLKRIHEAARALVGWRSVTMSVFGARVQSRGHHTPTASE